MTYNAPDTISDLSSLSWQEFEEFATATLKAYYAGFNVTLAETRLSKDGGRDGEAIHILGAPDSDEPLALAFRLWVEIKKRTGSNVNLSDLGKHVVRAINESVSKILFVTNVHYAEEVQRELEIFCEKCRLPYGLIGGEQLIELSKRIRSSTAKSPTSPLGLGADSAVAPSVDESAPAANPTVVDIAWSFVARPNLGESASPAAVCCVEAGDPIFISVWGRVTEASSPIFLDLRPMPAPSEDFVVLEYGSSRPSPLAEGDRFRKMFVVPEVPPRGVCSETIGWRLSSAPKTEITARLRSTARVELKSALLSDWLPGSRRNLVVKLEQRVLGWLESRESSVIFLQAPAGCGKSHITRKLRAKWLKSAANEIYLDGEVEYNDQRILGQILRATVPGFGSLLFEDTHEALASWLTGLGIPARRAESFARALIGEQGSSTRALGEVLSVALAHHSATSPVVVLVEDLHKVHPSGLALLRELLVLTMKAQSSRVLFVLTSRFESALTGSNVRQAWSSELQSLNAIGGASTHTVPELSMRDAQSLLSRSVRRLPRSAICSIVEQVGRRPFALREALAFLLETGALARDAKVASIVVSRPDKLLNAIDREELVDATKLRLVLFLERADSWLEAFLQAGACLGRQFSPEVCRQAVAPRASSSELDRALAACEARQLLRPSSRSPNAVEFDHDLIRSVILSSLGGITQRRIASLLYARLSREEAPDILAKLAFQAGLARQCRSHAEDAATAAKHRQQYADAAEGYYLTLTAIDPMLSTKLLEREGQKDRRLFLDEALNVAVQHQYELAGECPDPITVLGLLLELLDCLVATTSGSGEAVQSVLSEAMMFARRGRNDLALARLRLAEGTQLFERDRPSAALEAHQQAEVLFDSAKGAARSSERSQNLVRIAVCERQLGSVQKSLDSLRYAVKTRQTGDWATFVKIVLNIGAAYLHTDLGRVRHYWERGVEIARRRNVPERLAHALTDLGHLDLLEGENALARERLEEALRIAEERGLQNHLLRCFLNLGCLELADGRFQFAEELLLEAEDLALCNRIGRRLWRVEANLATVMEGYRRLDDAYAYDQRALQLIRERLHETERESEPPERASPGRIHLPLLNIALRASESVLHAKLYDSISAELRQQLDTWLAMIDKPTQIKLPPILGGHLIGLGDGLRFIVTE